MATEARVQSDARIQGQGDTSSHAQAHDRTFAVASFDILFESGLRIRGEVRAIPDGRRKPVVLLGHGFRAHRLWSFWPSAAERFAEAGFYAVSFDFSRIAAEEDRLHAEVAAETATFGQELADWEAVLSRLLDRELPLADEADEKRIAVLGHSRAAGSAVLLSSAQPQIVAVVAWNGGVSSPLVPAAAEGASLTLREEAILRDLKENADRYDVAGAFQRLAIPALVVYGTADHERLLNAVNELQQARPEQSFLPVRGADHSFGAKHPFEGIGGHLEEALNETVRFLKRTLSADEQNEGVAQ